VGYSIDGDSTLVLLKISHSMNFGHFKETAVVVCIDSL
jgi:hypothetical protein